AAAEAGPAQQALAVVAAALTFAYIGRFWLGLFAGKRRTSARAVSPLLVGPVAALAAVALAGGVAVAPFAELAADAAAVSHGAAVELHAAYHLEASEANVMALGAWALGALLLLVPAAWRPLAGAV